MEVLPDGGVQTALPLPGLPYTVESVIVPASISPTALAAGRLPIATTPRVAASVVPVSAAIQARAFMSKSPRPGGRPPLSRPRCRALLLATTPDSGGPGVVTWQRSALRRSNVAKGVGVTGVWGFVDVGRQAGMPTAEVAIGASAVVLPCGS